MKPQCPRCHSFKTMSDRALVFYVGCGLVVTGTLLSFLVFPLFVIPIGLLFMGGCLAVNPSKQACQDCKMKFET